ncbi:MAG: pentapeptide repeat-containing protein, partial [Campylobacter sp.]|nr:pentapeptide repeat-containing protein [Campylobacter sp.]
DKTVDFSYTKFQQNAIFHNTIFNGLTEFSGTKFAKTALFLGAKFENIVKFIDTNFSSYAFFKNTKFQAQAYFSIAEFIGNAYFNNTIFSDYADFYGAEFEALACFYGATFEKPMNFSSVVFKDFNKADFVNLNIEKIDMESIKDSVEENYKDEDYAEEYKDDKNEIKKLDLKYKIRCANDFRDSFRAIKHSLIETNNNLEASNFHKLELYAKEIGLKYEAEKENSQFANTKKKENITNKSKFFKDFVGPNFLFILSFVAIMSSQIIAAGFSFIIAYLTFIAFCLFSIYIVGCVLRDIVTFNFQKYKNIFEKIKLAIKEANAQKINNFSIFVDYVKLQIYRITSEHHTDFLRILNFTIAVIATNGLFIILSSKVGNSNLYAINILLIIFLLFLIFYCYDNLNISATTGVCLAFICLFLMILFIINSQFGFYAEVLFSMLLYVVFMALLYWFFVTKKSLIIVLTRLAIYFVFVLILYLYPNMILPFANSNLEIQNRHLNSNIAEANKTEIIELASVINPEFNATKNPNLSENLSISELNEYKKFIVENKEILKDSNATNEKFKQAIYADSSRDKTIKCISFIYAIILGLCLFSLQKTARRNSVVPS